MHILYNHAYLKYAMKKITVDELRYFILENYCQQVEISKQNSFYLMKRQKKPTIVCN